MRILGKRKRPVSPEKAAGRAKVICIVLLLAFGFILLTSNPGKKTEPKTENDRIAELMDAGLDSAIRAYGFEDYEVFFKGEIETFAEKTFHKEESIIPSLRMKLDVFSDMKSLPEMQRNIKLSDIQKEIDRLERQLSEAVREENRNRTVKARRIRFRALGDKCYTFYQELKRDSLYAMHFIDASDFGADEGKAYEKIQSALKETEENK